MHFWKPLDARVPAPSSRFVEKGLEQKVRKRLVAAFALSKIGAANVAMAQTTPLARNGFWTAFRSIGSDTGRSICGMNLDDTSTGRSVQIKWPPGLSAFVIQIFKTVWRVPPNASVRSLCG
jgi:hypothetical protein